MLKTLQFPDRGFTAQANAQQEFSQGVIRELRGILSGEVDVGASATLHTEAAHRLWGTVEVRQNGRSFIRLEPSELVLLDALLNGRKGTATNPTSNATNQAFKAAWGLPLDFFMPGAVIDASGDAVYVATKFGDYGDACTEWSAPTSGDRGRMRVEARTRSRVAGTGYWRPAWTQTRVDLSSASTSRQHVERFDRPTALYGILVRTHDSSADTSSIDGSRVDGLIRAMRPSVLRPEGSTEIHHARWGQMKEAVHRRFKLPAAEEFTGVGWVELEDDANPSIRNGFGIRQGVSLSIEFDTQTTAEDHFAAVTPDSGDEAILTFLGYEFIKAPAGTGRPTPVAVSTDAGLQAAQQLGAL